MVSLSWNYNRQIHFSRANHQSYQVRPPRPAAFRAVQTSIPASVVDYPTLSLLGIPLEIRAGIWRLITDDIHAQPIVDWHSKPENAYDGLIYTCRKIYHESASFWRRSVLQQNRVTELMDQPYSRSALEGMRSLTLEIPFNMPEEFFRQAAFMLSHYSPYLEELRLFFTGKDAYGVKAYLHGCGNALPQAGSKSQKLLGDGQSYQARIPLVHSIVLLRNLRVLVLSNLNLPVLQAHVLLHKPKLQKLFVVHDPRSTLHTRVYTWQKTGNREADDLANRMAKIILPIKQDFPPVRDLHISANAALSSLQVASKVRNTTERVTWIVPDSSRQADATNGDWYRDTGILLHKLASGAKKLHTLRICIEGPIYEDHYSYGDFMGGYNLNVPNMFQLKRLELHICSRSRWLGTEFVERIPKSLERLYISDSLLSVDQMIAVVENIYMYGEEGFVPTRTNRFSMDFATGKFRRCHDRTTLVGEDLKREDFIHLHSGNLGFVSYEYTPSSDSEEAADQRAAIMKLNGRLLDRELNSHLGIFKAGDPIKPRYLEDGVCSDYERLVPEHAAIEEAVRKMEFEGPTKDDVHENDLDLSNTCSHTFGNRPYFAGYSYSFSAQMFAMEKVAKLGELPRRKWPVDVEVGKHEHWICA